MEKIPIKKSLGDEEFRKFCGEMLDSARKNVYIIAGELGSLTFPDLQMATYKASKRPGVKVKMYATEFTPITSRNYAVACGYELFIGKKGLKKHYLVVDEKDFVESLDKEIGKPTIVGERCGWAHYGNRNAAKEILKQFRDLVADKDTKKISAVDVEAEPLYQFLRS